jgi:uncharacterized CHY-type Zn-finger protein
MTDRAARCAHCETRIVDPTTQVVHGDKIYCCANCSAAMEQAGSGSDPQTRAREGAFRCAHCSVAIVDESTMQASGERAFCCPNCARAMDESDRTPHSHEGETLPADDRARVMR